MTIIVDERSLSDSYRIYFDRRSPAAHAMLGEITLGQQLLFCALGLGGRGGQGQAGADLSKGELVTRADARALGQTHHSPIQTHDEIRRSA